MGADAKECVLVETKRTRVAVSLCNEDEESVLVLECRQGHVFLVWFPLTLVVFTWPTPAILK